MLKSKILAGVAVLLCCGPVRSWHLDDTDVGSKLFSIGPRAAYIAPKDSVNEGDWYGGLQTRLRLGPVIGIEGSADYRQSKFPDDTTVRTFPVQASLLLYLTPQFRLSPFLLGGGGWYFTRTESPGFKDTNNRFGVHAGGGLELKLSEHVSIDVSGRYIWVEDVSTRNRSVVNRDYDDSGPMGTAGINFHF